MTRSTLDQVQAEFDRRVEQVERFLMSEQGVRMRNRVAAALIAAAPVVAVAARRRLPLIGRVAGTATLAAVVVNLAGRIRDWDSHHDLKASGNSPVAG